MVEAERGWTVEALVEAIWALERDLGLLERRFGGEVLWLLLRMETYYRLARALHVFSTPHGDSTRWQDLVPTPRMLLDVVAKDALIGGGEREVMVFDHARKVPVDGAHVDIYTADLLRELGEGVETVESVYRGKHLSPRAPGRRYLDLLGAGSGLAQRIPVRWSAEDAAAIETLTGEVHLRFGVELPFARLFARELRHFRFARAYYRALLKRRRPRRIYLVVSYSYYKRPLIAAARALGVETVEIQHGTFSPFHLGYSFPDYAEHGPLPYFPDRLWVFGEYWRTAAPIPLPPERIEVYGFPHFTRQRATVAEVPKEPRQVLFVSQGVIGARLAAILRDVAPALPEHRFVFKLHPGEYPTWRSENPALVEAAALPNVEVIDHNERPLYAWFKSSAVQVGVFSTALYEGLGLGCRTIIADLPGAEYMRALVAQGHVVFAADAAAVVAGIEAQDAGAVDTSLFFHPEPRCPSR